MKGSHCCGAQQGLAAPSDRSVGHQGTSQVVILHLHRQIGGQARRRASPHATPVQAQTSQRPCFVCRLVCCEGRLCFPRPRCFAPRIRVPGKSSSRSRMAGLPEPLRLLQARLASVRGRWAPGPPRAPPHQPGSLDSSSCSCEHGAFRKHAQPIRRPLAQQCCHRPVITRTGLASSLSCGMARGCALGS